MTRTSMVSLIPIIQQLKILFQCQKEILVILCTKILKRNVDLGSFHEFTFYFADRDRDSGSLKIWGFPSDD